MRLTNTLRDAFIHAVMNDVPRVDYDEQAEKLLMERAVELLPPKVRAVWNDKSLRDYVNTVHVYIENFSCYLPVLDRDTFLAAVSEELRGKLQELALRDEEQITRDRELRERLRGAVASVTTTKALRTALPEFDKYLPPEEAKTANLPALANVITDFVRAGWPKGKTA